MPEDEISKNGEVQYNLHPAHKVKTLLSMKAKRAVKRITFKPSEADPGKTLNVHMPKLNTNEVLVPGSLVLRFDIDLYGGHANNFLVQNMSRALDVYDVDLKAQPASISSAISGLHRIIIVFSLFSN